MAMMKCPRCRKAIPFAAVSHQCGWRATISRPVEMEPPPLSTEQARGYIERCRQILAQKKPEDIDRERIREEADREARKRGMHSAQCVCERCYRLRMDALQPRTAGQDDQERRAA